MQILTMDGSKIVYDVYGQSHKPPLILLHGNNGRANDFKRQIKVYQTHFYVIAIDTRGHGRSTNEADDLTYQTLVQDLESLRQQLKLERMILVGYSDGANLALRYAHDFPMYVAAMVLNAPNLSLAGLYAPIVWIARFLTAILHGLRHGSAFLMRKYLQTALMFEPLGIQLSDLTTIQAPTLVFVGQFDFIKRQHTQAIVAHLPKGHVQIIKWRTHLIMQTEPQLFARVTQTFLKEQGI
ncbi:alpha/beta hydrolase [Weissella diestrammenae]|uniref:Alpha/beta hydrolase n=1 Tax=Weissella diestrammenae TaxID=1162633 RepID=A0A7G9T6Y2_9LACO|nr:alpha/beta hydrolase [Weissella diestrammenae]MCM0582546.1 alpha/beta hydrolase [Weissella diestrammenae]QNN75857.1 alpha/beta hydrolase [Weissella diestrammenae]